MNELYIKGWLCKDYDGAVATSENKDDTGWDNRAIVKQVEAFAEEYGMVGRYKKGLGGRKGYIEDANIRIYLTDNECSIDEAVESLLYKLEGEIKTDIALTGYSEYTITGYDIKDFSIGGHDLECELSSHIGEYIHFILGCE